MAEQSGEKDMLMEEFAFRVGTEEDIYSLVGLRESMQLEINQMNFGGNIEEYRDSVRRYILENLSAGKVIFFVAEHGNKIVSMAGLISYTKIPSMSAGSGKIGYVTSVYTQPSWRRRGLAGELMKRLIEHSRFEGIEKLHLGATQLGRGLYERLGFLPPASVTLELRFHTYRK